MSECEQGLLEQFKTPLSNDAGAPVEHLTPPTEGGPVTSTWKRWCSIAFHRMKSELLSSPSAGAFIETETQEISLLDHTKQLSGVQFRQACDSTFVTVLMWMYEHRDWLLVALVGLFTAASAAWIGFVAEHLSDLKLGFCRGLPWLNRELCCGSASAVDVLSNSCRPVTRFTPSMIGPRDLPELDTDVGPALSKTEELLVNQLAVWTSWDQVFGGGSTTNFLVYVLIGVFLAYVAGVLVVALAPAAAGSGIPEVKTVLGGFWLKRVMHPWTLFVKTVALALAVASGLALGKEGPMVHIGAAYAAILGRNVPSPAAPLSLPFGPNAYSGKATEVNALISAGSAAGVASAFGAPLGGVLFALEEVSTYFPPSTLYKTLFCAVVSAIVLKNVSAAHSGNGSIFELNTLGGSWVVSELPLFVLTGVVGGVVGAAFILVTRSLTLFRIRARADQAPGFFSFIYRGGGLRELILVAFVGNLCNYVCPLLRVSSIHAMSQLFSRCGQQTHGVDVFGLCVKQGDDSLVPNQSALLLVNLFMAFALFSLNATLTYGTCIPAGLFVPTLTMGALLGRIIGHLFISTATWTAARLQWLEVIFPDIDTIHPGAYSLLGAISVLSGTSRMTVSLVIIAFEMSGGLAYIVPYMIVTLVAKGVSEALIEPSVYDVAIHIKKLPFLHLNPLKSDHDVAFGVQVREVMTTEVVCISLAQRWNLRWVLTLVTDFTFSHYPVVRDVEDRVLLGVVNRKELIRAFEHVSRFEASVGKDRRVIFAASESDEPGTTIDFSHLVRPVLFTAHPSNNLSHVHHLFVKLGLSYIVFATEGRLAGVISKKAFLARLEKSRH